MRREVWLRAKAGTPIRAALAAVFAEMMSEERGLPEPERPAIDPERKAIETTASDDDWSAAATRRTIEDEPWDEDDE